MSIWKRSFSFLQALAMSAAFSDASKRADMKDRIVKQRKEKKIRKTESTQV
jgi:hypothetical protein